MRPSQQQRWLGRPLIFGPDAPEAAVIFLHGHDEGPENGWPERFLAIRQAHPRWRWVHLRAPRLPQTCLGGAVCPAWGNYLIPLCTRVGNADYDNPDREGWYAASVSAVHKCIDSLLNDHKLASQKVAVVGFSQGAAVALEAALTYCTSSLGEPADAKEEVMPVAAGAAALSCGADRQVAACIALCGWLPQRVRAALKLPRPGLLPPRVLLLHGTADPSVEFGCSVDAEAHLRKAGVPVSLERFPGCDHGHTWPSQMYSSILDRYLSTAFGECCAEDTIAPQVDRHIGYGDFESVS